MSNNTVGGRVITLSELRTQRRLEWGWLGCSMGSAEPTGGIKVPLPASSTRVVGSSSCQPETILPACPLYTGLGEEIIDSTWWSLKNNRALK